ncbi:MAG: type II toxin-antitoxin system RelE/ParE family toxin [Pseudomonadota bacterium]
MLTLKISSLAIEDLDRIFRDGVFRFGQSQAEAYQLEIFAVMESLASTPEMGTTLDTSIKNLRVFARPQSCRIVYRLSGDDLLIARVIHGRQDLERALDDL